MIPGGWELEGDLTAEKMFSTTCLLRLAEKLKNSCSSQKLKSDAFKFKKKTKHAIIRTKMVNRQNKLSRKMVYSLPLCGFT